MFRCQISEASSVDTKEKMRAVTTELEAELAKLPETPTADSGGAAAEQDVAEAERAQ